ncbi:hypothetical protein MAXJ12_08444 [Mesorhizobium alhagi CCNWXJ12-2]|uniref:Uncharacterized protein n=1 Tax=Mesorhizobium alhagi CCNWXJ12-2 TaxID=1107882 RepID=H0HNG6_9HYPH|nr:hypothetical protein MAXJ12_08444 [Mesorhizobium alhagi CCNWXJ12-2]
MLGRWMVAGMVVLIGLAWLARFDVNGVSRGDGWPGAYIVDRWTGEIKFCSAVRCASTRDGPANE